MIKNEIYNLCKKIQPIYRSITGPGNVQTLRILKKINKNLKILKFVSGKKVFDWTIPKVWKIKNAWIKNENSGKKIINFEDNLLSVVGYSDSVNKVLSYKELIKKIHTSKMNPRSTPYVTSYYKKDWGFCMPQIIKNKLSKNSKYRVFINSKKKNGDLSVGEIFIPGKRKEEILLTTYICHPFMANNELSGPAVLIFLSKWIQKKKRKFSYRILFSSETIGTIGYINHNFKHLKTKVLAGYVLTCLGDEKLFSYLKSKSENSLSDKIALPVFKKLKYKKKIYNWLQRGSDERQFNAPGVELNIGSIMRSKYKTFKEYHTSADSLGKLVTSDGLFQSYNFIKKIIKRIEKSHIPTSNIVCEPFLSKRQMYPTLSKAGNISKIQNDTWNFLSFCNGNYLIEEIANKIKITNSQALRIAKILKKHKIIEF